MRRTLSASIDVPVRFNEADSLGIVWHGHYIRYFEDSREAFGAQYGFTYLDFYRNGLVTPIVSVNCHFKKPLRYGDTVRVEATYIDCLAAKIHFEYKLINSNTGELTATGESVQVMLKKDDHSLLWTIPPFLEEWKEKWGVAQMSG